MAQASAREQNKLLDKGLREYDRGELEFKVLTTGASGIRYPAKAFADWIDARLNELRCAGHKNPVRQLALTLQCAEKRISEWRALETVDESTVDRVMTRHGGYSRHDLYPDGVAPQPAEDDDVARVVANCARPGCNAERNGGRFCHEHTEELARIRAELEAEGAVMSANGGAQRRACKPEAKSKQPMCCNPSCWFPRVPGERFCADCRVAGWVEDDDGIVLTEVGL